MRHFKRLLCVWKKTTLLIIICAGLNAKPMVIVAPPTISINVSTTTDFIDGGRTVSPASPYALSAVIDDPTDPARILGIDFAVLDADSPLESLVVSAQSNNQTVIPNANLALTGLGAGRNLKITPATFGYAAITITVSDGVNTSMYVLNYAASQASVNPNTTRFHTSTCDASTAQAISNKYMFVADDENQVLRLYDRQNSGLPLAGFDFTSSLGLTNLSNGVPREVDIEASVRIGNRLFWLGSGSNASNGNARPNRSRLFATDVSGSEQNTALTYVGRFDALKANMLAWDANNGHGLGANYLGLTASAAAGIEPEAAAGNGFNIEGLTMAPNDATAYVAFRAPIVPASARTKALVMLVTNFTTLVAGNPTATTATFGAPILLDLGGRGIREIKKNASGQYLIIAGPHDNATGNAPKDFRLYSWSGLPADAPVLRNYNLTSRSVFGSFESIVDLPADLSQTNAIQLLVDNGDANYYADGVSAKDLPQNNHKKFRSEQIILCDIGELNLTTNIDSQSTTYEAGRVVATNQISNAMIDYKGYQSVVLNPGFVTNGTVFRAYIGGCE